MGSDLSDALPEYDFSKARRARHAGRVNDDTKVGITMADGSVVIRTLGEIKRELVAQNGRQNER